MRERSGRQDVPQRSGPNGLARLASEANANTESGGEAEPRDGSGGVTGWARAAQLAKPERASHSAARRIVKWERRLVEVAKASANRPQKGCFEGGNRSDLPRCRVRRNLKKGRESAGYSDGLANVIVAPVATRWRCFILVSEIHILLATLPTAG